MAIGTSVIARLGQVKNSYHCINFSQSVSYSAGTQAASQNEILGIVGMMDTKKHPSPDVLA